MRMEWLQQFLVLVQWQNFRLAAQHLQISQQALSKNLAALEQYLGVSLIQRNQRFQSLTTAGKRLLATSPALLAQWQQLQQNSETPDTPRKASLAIGYTVFWSRFLMEQAIQQFHLQNPEVYLHLQHLSPTELEQALLQQEIDLGLGVHFIDPSLCTQTVAESLVVTVSPTARADSSIRGGKLHQGHFVSTNWEPTLPRHFAAESNNVNWMLSFSQCSQMSLDLPDCLIQDELKSDSLQKHLATESPKPFPLQVAWVNDLPLSHEAQSFIKILQGIIIKPHETT